MTPAQRDLLIASLQPLVNIANAFDANELDDTARRFWGDFSQIANTRDPTTIELYAGRGGRQLLTLQDCFNARDAQALLLTIS